MSAETIEQVRARKDEAAAFARKRAESRQRVLEINSKPQRDADAIYAQRFDLAEMWVEAHVLFHGRADVVQVGKDGFYWKSPSMIIATFVAWDESARIALEVTS